MCTLLTFVLTRLLPCPRPPSGVRSPPLVSLSKASSLCSPIFQRPVNCSCFRKISCLRMGPMPAAALLTARSQGGFGDRGLCRAEVGERRGGEAPGPQWVNGLAEVKLQMETVLTGYWGKRRPCRPQPPSVTAASDDPTVNLSDPLTGDATFKPTSGNQNSKHRIFPKAPSSGLGAGS